MRNSEDVFQGLSMSFFRLLVESTNKHNHSAHIRLLLVICAVLVFVGVEAVKIVFRTNFGSKGLSLFRSILSSIAFGVIAYLAYEGSRGGIREIDEFGSPHSFVIVMIFYGILSIYILSKSILQKIKKPNPKIHPNYRGESTLLAFLIGSGWSPAKVQNFGEPLLTLAFGVFVMAINLLWGIPLVFCAISVWLHLWMETKLGLGEVRDVLAERGHTISREGKFAEVKN